MNAERLFSVEFTRNARRTPRLTYDARSLSAREPDRPQVSPKSRRKLPTTPTESTNRLNVEFGQLQCTTSWDRLSSTGRDHRPVYLNVTPDYCPSPVRSPSPILNPTMQKTSLLRKLHFQGRALMGQDQSKSSMTAFSNSFDSATVYQTNRHSLAPRRADSTASDDTQSTSLREPNRPIAGSTGSLQANSTGLRRQKKLSLERRSGSSTRSTSTNGMAKSQRTQSQSAKTVTKKSNGISGSSQAIINFCIENAKGDVASRVVTRMANKREDFNQFVSSLNSENWNAFVGSLRDYFQAVVQNLQSSDKIKEISVTYGADQVPRRAWGFKADYFAVMASALTTECVFLDGAAHQPTEAIEAWAELAELMFSNIRDGYYQRIRYLRKNSHCFNQLFTQSSDQSTEDSTNQLLTPNPSPNRLSPNPNSKPPTDRRSSTLRTQNTMVSGDTVRS